MLDQNDLNQIGNLIDKKMDVRLEPMQKDIDLLKKDMKSVKKDVAETRNDIKTLISYFDRDYVDLRKRVEAIEEHLGFTSSH